MLQQGCVARDAEFDAPEAHRRHYATIAKGYTEGLANAMEEGQIADDLDPEFLSYVLMGLAEFLGARLSDLGPRLSKEDAFEQLMTFITRGLGAS